MKNFYYWPNLKKEVATFMARCFDCQQVKAKCKHQGGLLQVILIPKWKWEVISMDFVKGFPRKYRQHDFIVVVVDRLMKVANFILVKLTYSANDIAHVFIRDVVRLHGFLNNLCQIGMLSSLPSF